MKFDGLDALLVSMGKGKGCKDGKDGSFLNVKVKGKVNLRVRFGFTFVGTISPTFRLEEAYGFFDSSVVHDGSVEFDGRGKINIQGNQFKQKSILPNPLKNYEFSHPGIVTLRPELDILATMIGEGELDGKFTADFAGGNEDTFTTFNQPKGLGVSLLLSREHLADPRSSGCQR